MPTCLKVFAGVSWLSKSFNRRKFAVASIDTIFSSRALYCVLLLLEKKMCPQTRYVQSCRTLPTPALISIFLETQTSWDTMRSLRTRHIPDLRRNVSCWYGFPYCSLTHPLSCHTALSLRLFSLGRGRSSRFETGFLWYWLDTCTTLNSSLSCAWAFIFAGTMLLVLRPPTLNAGVNEFYMQTIKAEASIV